MNKNTNLNKNVNHSFLLPFILSKLDVQVSDVESQLLDYLNGVFVLSLISFICLLNILFYIFANLYIKNSKYNDADKYPLLSKFCRRYSKVTLLYISIEAFTCIFCLLGLIVLSFYGMTTIVKFNIF